MNKSAERRSSLRRPIHHEATLRTADGFGLGCIITDFCLDGMFIKFPGSHQGRIAQPPELQSQNAVIELSFTGDKGQVLSVQAHIVHAIEGACGLRFIQRYDRAVQSLMNVSISAGLAVEHAVPVQKIVDQCIVCIRHEFGNLMEAFWPAVVEMLKQDAVKASNDQRANMLMAHADKFQSQKNSLQQVLMQAVQDPVAAFSAHLEKRKAMNDKLTIIDKEEFEDWLLARVLIMKCEAEYQSLLLPLKLRLDALGVGDKRHHQSVFGPTLLVSAFQAALHVLIKDKQAEKNIFRLFEHQVMAGLEPLYQALNDILIGHNILPKLNVKQSLLIKNVNSIERPQTQKSERERAASDAVSQQPLPNPASPQMKPPSGIISPVESSRSFTLPPFSQGEMPRPAADAAMEVQEPPRLTLDDIGHLIKHLQPVSSAESAGLNLPAYTPEELAQSLAVLQASRHEAGRIDSPNLMERVKDKLRQSGEKALQDQHKTAIDVVDRFLLSMRDNPRISDHAKQLLYKLDVPILKVMLKDEGFFDNRQSSVRAVINRIAQLGAKDAKLHPSSKARIDNLVDRLITDFDSDTAVFDETLAELDELLNKQNLVYVKNVERVAAAAEGTFRVEEAVVAVTEAINQRIASKFVPSAVVTLVNEGWKDYLQLTYIKHGCDSLPWHEALSVLDRLIAYGDDPRIPIDIKVLLPKIQEGLKLVSSANEASMTVREALKEFILNAPKGMHLSEQAQKLSLPDNEEDQLRRNISKSNELKDWIIKIKSLPLGAWFRFTRPDQDASYIRLVWVAKGFSKFVFVNHQGMRVIELGLFKLADYFKQGVMSYEPDYELPIVNQGLDAMVKDVYDRLAYETSHDTGTGLIKKAEFCRQVRLLMKHGRRTSACSLLFIRFRDAQHKPVALSDGFAKQVVEVISGRSFRQAILGRLAESDFVLFSVTDETPGFRAECQGALIELCQSAEESGQEMLVTLGESRAHLGFNNPEAMIRHAAEIIEAAAKAAPTEDAKEEALDETLDVLKEDLDSAGQYADDAANSEPEAADFDQLNYTLFSQATAALVRDNANAEKSAHARIEHNRQLALFYVIEGASQAYLPDNQKEAEAFDQWWINFLQRLQVSQAEWVSQHDCIRICLSGYAFNSSDLVGQLTALTESQQVSADRICFDIYDSYRIEDVELASIGMNTLKKLGYRFCLDHFGTERCPFAYMKALPVDMIKIDESFIVALNQSGTDTVADTEAAADVDEANADSITEIAHYLGKKVLASGVDTAVCLQKMKYLNVDFVQGSTVSKWQPFSV
jgi:EAL domain-containing protein (putative c-di-GMP-specific phosphodiesterase class I)